LPIDLDIGDDVVVDDDDALLDLDGELLV